MAESALSVTEVGRRVLAECQPAHSLSLQFERCHILVRSNLAELIDRLRDYYEDFVSPESAPTVTVNVIEAAVPALDCTFTEQPRSPGKTRKEEFCDARDGRIVRKARTGMVFMFGPQMQLAIGPCADNLNQVINFINNRHVAWGLDQRRLLLHAAGVCVGATGLGLAGTSGAGKSTLALHLLSRGLSFVSNDRLMIASDAQGLSMHGLAKMPRVNPGTLLHNPQLVQLLPAVRRQQLSDLPTGELWELEEKHDVPIGCVYGPGRFPLTARLCGLVVLTWKHGGGPPIAREDTLRERSDLLPAIMKSPGVFYLQTGRPGTYAHVAGDYLDVLGDCPVLEIAGGASFTEAAALCVAFLERYGTDNDGRAGDDDGE